MGKTLLLGLVSFVIIIAGCTQQYSMTDNFSTTTQNMTSQYEKLANSDLQILSIKWEGDYEIVESSGECLGNNKGNAVITINCTKTDLLCEIYANGKRSNYPPNSNGIQFCRDRGLNILTEYDNTEQVWFTPLDKDYIIKVCCSYLDNNGNYLKDYEVCQDTILKAYCKS